MAGSAPRPDFIFSATQLANRPCDGFCPDPVASGTSLSARLVRHDRDGLRHPLWNDGLLGLSIFCLVVAFLVLYAPVVLSQRDDSRHCLPLLPVLDALR